VRGVLFVIRFSTVASKAALRMSGVNTAGSLEILGVKVGEKRIVRLLAGGLPPAERPGLQKAPLLLFQTITTV